MTNIIKALAFIGAAILLAAYGRTVFAVDDPTTVERVAVSDDDSVPAFPGAQGFGAHTPGGRGGRVIAVTSLDAEGTGTLDAALRAKGPRIVVFRVGGNDRT